MNKVIITSFVIVMFLSLSFASINTVTAQTGSWSLSGWQTSGSATIGSIWIIQPVLTINGTSYTYNTVSPYISQLQWLQSMGATGGCGASRTINECITQFQHAMPWSLSSWSTTGCGSWATQPVLIIDGSYYTYGTPDPYISQLQWLQSIGASGPLSTMISQLQSVIPEFQRVWTVNVNLSASPTSINAGQSSTLSWSTSNATSCSASGGWSGGKSTSGSQTVSPASTSTYNLSCSNSCQSASSSTTVTVAAPLAVPLSVSGNRGTITKNINENFNIYWGTANVVSGSVSGPGLLSSDVLAGAVPIYRSATLSQPTAGTYVYTISGVGPNGETKTDFVTINVLAPLLPPICTIDADPKLLVMPKNTSTLTWSCNRVISGCAISDDNAGVTDIGAVASSGSRDTPVIPSTTKFTLQCPGAADTSVIIKFFDLYLKEIIPQ